MKARKRDGLREQLIEGLQQDLAAELGTMLRYLQQASLVTGLAGEELRELLREEIADELGHAQYLADKIFTLGGVPKVAPASFQTKSQLKAMVEYDLEMERQDIEHYKQHAALADEFGDIGLKVKLEEIAADETEHAEALERILKGL